MGCEKNMSFLVIPKLQKGLKKWKKIGYEMCLPNLSKGKAFETGRHRAVFTLGCDTLVGFKWAMTVMT